MVVNEFITTREAKKILQVSEDTLRRWADGNLVPSIRTPGGQRLYDIREYVNKKCPEETIKEKICYCRVSSQGQKEDLQKQVQYMQEHFPEHRIIQDIGSGINFKRKGLRTILERSCQGLVSEVVVAYRDRLCRFAFELVEWFFQLNKVKLVVLNQSLDASEQSELAEDLLAIINVFNCRINGKRKYKKIEDTLKSITEEDKTQCSSKSEVETKSGSCQNT